ncbi:PhoH family protein [Bifidobacterium magnum]|uniref:PhoH family protein n=1 Tax=Bifidobacterium magnum TaxID=1692 RepID=UPI0003B578D7|nr:PhoH family protein [Bifidobacterium magnum]
MATTTRTVTVPDQLDPVAVFGPYDEVLRELESAYDELTMRVRGNTVVIRSSTQEGEHQASEAQDTLETLIEMAFDEPITKDMVRRMLDQRVLRKPVRQRVPGHGAGAQSLRRATASVQPTKRDENAQYRKPQAYGTIAFANGAPVRPKTAGQTAYVNAIASHTITFGIGPAGTGKTYLAVAQAVQAFERGSIRRIILTRPAVEAGERLGFLPGTLNDKVDPYLRPLYDALGDMLGTDQLRRLMADGTIEVAPLAYMRGRTLNDAFVILDEAQNTTEQQMKMFLTRLGFNTTMVVTGDSTQVDLDVPRSGLRSIERILGGIDDIAFIHLGSADVVRHELVGRIVQAYDKADAAREQETHSRHNTRKDTHQ